jgi:hypothetical protein
MFLGLPIVETDGMRFRTHKHDTGAGEHGESEQDESLPHDGKEKKKEAQMHREKEVGSRSAVQSWVYVGYE